MPKFFVKSEQIKDDKIINIIGEDVKHISKVLRAKIGDEINICNSDNGYNYLCNILKVEETNIICNIKEKLDSISEPNVYIHVIQGLPKSDKMEWIIEKGTEIGVSEFTPIRMKYCVCKAEGKDAIKKVERWNKISEVAAKQSGRDYIPKVNPILNFEKVYQIIEKCDIVLVAYEKEKNISLKHELENIKIKNPTIGVIIGPEGGISEEEINFLKEKNAKVITLGPRILRTETAPLVISGNILYALENI